MVVPYGANRRVFTNDRGYQGVEGIFSMPTNFYLGDDYVADSEEKQADGSPQVRGSNPRQNKPTFYLGAAGHNFNIEVGYQYEGLYKDGLDAGWSAYSAIALDYKTPARQVESVHNWYQSTEPNNRQPQVSGKAVPAKILLQSNGSVETNVGVFGDPETLEGVAPNIYPSVIRPDGQMPKTSIVVRRNVGMTQVTGAIGEDEGDGAYVHNIGFTGGFLYKWPQGGGETTRLPWSTGDHLYLPNSYNIGHETDGPDGGPIFVVNSDPPWHRLPSGASRPDQPLPAGANHTRYFQESVSVNLLTKPGELKALPKQLGTNSN